MCQRQKKIVPREGLSVSSADKQELDEVSPQQSRGNACHMSSLHVFYEKLCTMSSGIVSYASLYRFCPRFRCIVSVEPRVRVGVL
jgi:hypothetical protein